VFKDHIIQAEKLINETDYHRRDDDLDELKSKSPG
jgi:hypothetical protein